MTCPSCPACGAAETYTAQSGIVTGHWQRRCLSCGRVFRTVEIYEHQQEAVTFTRHMLGIVGTNGAHRERA